MDYYVDTQKGNTAHSVLKSSLPIPIFAAKIKTQNLDSSKVIQEDISSLDLDIVFANKFCRQIFNIKKKMDMKDKLKYLFLQGEHNNANDNNINPEYDEQLKYCFDKAFEETDINCYSPEYRVAKRNQISQMKQTSYYQQKNSQQIDLNLKQNNLKLESATQILENNHSKTSNTHTFQINPIPIICNSNSNQTTYKQESQDPNQIQLNNHDSKSQINYQNQHRNSFKQKAMTQQFLKQNFTKQEIKEYGMASSQLTTILYYHILQKLYMNLFNRQRMEHNAENSSAGKQENQSKQPPPSSIKNLSPQASQVFEQQQEDIFLDVMYIDSDKKRRKFFDIKIIEIEWENEQALMVIMNDISEKMRIKRMKEIDSFKNDILSTITHNLKTPLNGIILIAQTLQNQVQSKVKDAVSDILQNSKMLLYMINDILDYSRLSKGNIHLNLETFTLSKLIKEVLSVYKRQTQEKHVKLNYMLMGNLQVSCKLINDFSRIKQILINLVGNAAKCTFEGSITIIFEVTSPNHLLISIKDTGIGMSNETIKSIQKIQMKRKKDMRHGVGIGLLIGKSLLQLVGPDTEFRIESQENQGSTFSFKVFLVHNKSRCSNAEGLQISQLQNFFQIDKSAFDYNTSQMMQKNNFIISKSRNNQINTILEEVKPYEKQDTDNKLNFKECISQKIITEEPRDTYKNTESQDTDQYFLNLDSQRRKNTGDSKMKYKKEQFNLRKISLTDNGQVRNKPNINQNWNLKNQDFDFNNLLQNKKQHPEQSSMDEFEDEQQVEDGVVANKYIDTNINDLKASQIRVIPYHLNSTQIVNSKINKGSHGRANSGGSDSFRSNFNELFASYENSPTGQLKMQYEKSIDSNREYIQYNNVKFNLSPNYETDSVYTQTSKQNSEHFNNNYFGINKSLQKSVAKLSQYNSSFSNKEQINIFQSSPNQTKRQSFNQPYESSGIKTLRDHCEKSEPNFNILTYNQYQKLSVNDSLNNTPNYPTQQNLISKSNQLFLNNNNFLQNPVSQNIAREKLRIRQHSNTDNKEKNRERYYSAYQNSTYTSQTNKLFKFNSNANLEDSKKQSTFNYQGGGRLYEFIEESRDQDDNKNEIGESGAQKHLSINKQYHTIHSSTTLYVENNNINLTISQNIPFYDQKSIHNGQLNYQEAIQDYFENTTIKVLIVDDTVFNIKALRNLLQKYKTIQVEEAFNGQQAVQKVEQSQFDIIFMDINMPVMDGFQATKKIRELQKENKIFYKPIIIIVTAFGDQENRSLSFQSGADEHIEKPLTLDSIQKTIYQLIRR
ncbi:response regulator receiver domain protein (macronuclear) [Tetrahymena thermophila SB210]|uniref:Response regulator receiver domain protein n=1 Tax=Tetrahymena thermophila (strain SB210) TaxID=312017 RepID=Q229H4_TETTS|nr:response regulator receiver domain protein [Tetrahymena thermophila SB210]EAR81937.2 response regulator receiver domain protein [Tetrahymena thermophila SB210]|eukprot:XP_001029600.2 response regulator receiver domain protein [Tetrahymena thermophila SB210]